MKPTTRRIYRAFAADQDLGTGGNLCELSVFPRQLLNTELPVPERSASITSCYTWPLGPRCYGLRCFQQGREIQCCGHGLLCAARYWLETLETRSIELRMHDSVVTARREFLPFVETACASEWPLALQFPPVALQDIDIDQHIVALLGGTMPLRAAQTASKQGYLVFRYADNFALQSLHPPGARLARFTQRALIVTAKQTQGPASVSLRYFAPQYGVAEDSATGSAMRILVDFWQPELPTLRARQESPQGGTLYGSRRDDCTEVAGFCLPVAGKNRSTASIARQELL